MNIISMQLEYYLKLLSFTMFIIYINYLCFYLIIIEFQEESSWTLKYIVELVCLYLEQIKLDSKFIYTKKFICM